MATDTQLASVLRQLMDRSGAYTPGLLSRLALVPKTTIVNWMQGRVDRPRAWQDIVRVAEALRLSEADTTRLLQSAGHRSVAELLLGSVDPRDRLLLAPWAGSLRPVTVHTQGNAFGVPTPTLELIGRDAELAAARQLIAGGQRLITVTGPGGSGKTRLALQVTVETQHAFADGVAWVSLAHITSPDLVLPTIAQALGVEQTSGALRGVLLAERLRQLQLLLVLDNFEHLAAAAPAALAVMLTAPGITVLATSRCALGVGGEALIAVAPLPLPLLADAAPAALLASPAVRLFVQRARRVHPGFVLTAANAAAVAALCIRLDGLPLAIELAAARSKVVSPRELLEWFNTPAHGGVLPLLVGGARNLPSRQRTLRDSIAWSYHLLTPEAQLLLRRLSILAGGCTLEAATALAGVTAHTATDASADVQQTLDLLTRHHLLHQNEAANGPLRWVMLETTREYALDQLVESGEEAPLRLAWAAEPQPLLEQAAAAHSDAVLT